MLQLFCLLWIFILSVWKETNEFKIMETHRLNTVFKILDVFENYNKDLVSTVLTSLLADCKEAVQRHFRLTVTETAVVTDGKLICGLNDTLE